MRALLGWHGALRNFVVIVTNASFIVWCVRSWARSRD